MTDDRVQHYRLLHRLGAGGMGEVYLAEDTRLGRQLALKLLPTEFAQNISRRARFLTEARAAAALNHPNICTVYDAGQTAEGRLFIALELLEGETLDVRLKGGPLEVREVVRIGVQLASALEAAHAKGILHRDLKPANLHLDARGHLKVLDFGLAKRLVPEPGSAEDSTQWQTRTGGILGTPQYMSPEQAMGKALDPRSDLFSCGAVLYELLTGRGPFSGQPFAELLEQILHRPPEAIARFNYAVPPELERVVLKCLQKDPNQRYQSARELAVDLRGVEAQIRGEAVSDQPGQAQVVTLVLLGTNAEELERTVGVQETARILKTFQEAMGQGLRKFSQARQETSTGTTVLLSFARPSNAVQWALEMVTGASGPLQCRTGLHLGEVAAVTPEAGEQYGGHLTVCERLFELARPGQVLMGRAVFDSARQVLPMGSVEGAAELSWVSHGPYLFEGIEGPLEVCEVGATGRSPLSAPKTSERAQRQVRPDEEPVLGWRPAVGQAVPNTPWVLEEKLGEGGFGEVWVAQHPKFGERRVFKFCFRADRVRALKRELTLFRLLKENVGEHPNIVRLHEVYLDEPPFYLEEEYVEGKDLKRWCEAQGGIEQVPLETRLEIVAQAAEALQAAHDAGIIHRDVKPGNILVENRKSEVKLTDFGIGQVVSAEYLAGLTKAGFTQTVAGSTSSGTGTALYMAPELIAGRPATTRSDIYSLGVVLYQSVVGDFTRPVTVDWARQIVDPLLREDLERCFAGSPEDRFAGAGQMAANLRSLPQRVAAREKQQRLVRQIRRRRRLAAVFAAVTFSLLAIGIALGWGLWQAKRQGETLRRALYAAEMNVASQALERSDYGRVRTLLEKWRPTGAQKDLRGWEWRYLWGASQPDELELLTPTPDACSISVSPDGQRVVIGHLSGLLQLLDAATGQLLSTNQYPRSRAVALFAPRGDLLAVAAGRDPPQIEIRHSHSMAILRVLDPPAYTQKLTFSACGRFLAALGQAGTISVWEVAAWDLVASLDGGPLGVLLWSGGIDFAPEGRMLASGDFEGRVGLWDVETGQRIASFQAHADAITALALSPDGRTIASASGYVGKTIRLWEVASGTLLDELSGHRAYVFQVRFSADGGLLYSSSADQTIRIWDVSRRECVRVVAGYNDEVRCFALSPDENVLLAGTREPGVLAVDLTSRSRRPMHVVLPGQHRHVTIDGGTRNLVTVDEHGSVIRWDPRSDDRLERIDALGTNNVVATLSPDGRMLVCGDSAGINRVWCLKTGTLRAVLRGPEAAPIGTAFVEEGRVFVVVDTRGAISWWDTNSWESKGRFEIGYPPGAVAISEVGPTIFTITRGRVDCWEVPPGGSVRQFTMPEEPGDWVLACSPDGRLLVAVNRNRAAGAYYWDLESAAAGTLPVRHLFGIQSAAFSSGHDERLATGNGLDETVKLWDLNTGLEVLTLQSQDYGFYSIEFSASGDRLVARGGFMAPGRVHIWHAPSLEEIDAAVETAVSAGAGARKNPR